jgi:hypothetical protein
MVIRHVRLDCKKQDEQRNNGWGEKYAACDSSFLSLSPGLSLLPAFCHSLSLSVALSPIFRFPPTPPHAPLLFLPHFRSPSLPAFRATYPSAFSQEPPVLSQSEDCIIKLSGLCLGHIFGYLWAPFVWEYHTGELFYGFSLFMYISFHFLSLDTHARNARPPLPSIDPALMSSPPVGITLTLLHRR